MNATELYSAITYHNARAQHTMGKDTDNAMQLNRVCAVSHTQHGVNYYGNAKEN